ncbi:MAG: hypothetical protein Q8L09_04410 [Candidatus Moranbacteria bacterium]|nr:hypothetical protein [Candidatus Moranbacteria bacterium]
MKKIAIIFLVLMLVALSFPQVRRGLLALLVIHDLVPQTKTKWLDYAGKDIVVEHPEIDFNGEKIETNLYRPKKKGKQAALVYVHGVNELGKDDPRLDSLARSFSRAGFAVLVPQLPDMSPGKLNPKAISEIEKSIEYISQRKDIIAPEKIGVLGFSIGSGPAMIAVSNLQNQIPTKFMISFGGYYDLREVIGFCTTGHFFYQGKDYFIEPDPQSRWFFVRYYADFIKNREDAELLKQIAQIKIADPAADTSDMSGRLSAEGKSIFDLITNTDPARVNELTDSLPQELKDFILKLDPAKQVENIPADLFVVHSLNDNVIPFSQSVELYDVFKNKTRTQLYLLKIFSHVNPIFPPLTFASFFKEYLPEVFQLWRLVYEVLGYL